MRLRTLALLFLILATAGCAYAAPDTAGRIVVGILPVSDASFESYGADLANNLTYLIFRSLLENRRIEPALLNPGGNYTPDDEEFIQDFAKQTGVDAVVISKLTEDASTKGSANVRLGLETKLIGVAGNKQSPPHNATATITTHEINESTRSALQQAQKFWAAIPIVQQTAIATGGSQSVGDAGTLFSGMKTKTPLGKRAAELAASASGDVVAQAPIVSPQGSGQPGPAAGGPCSFKFAVHYKDKHSSSKSYNLIANGHEDLGKIEEGITTLNLPSGLVLLQVELRDVPFRLPAQGLYQMNTNLDCSKGEKNLIMDVGAGGQAVLHWE